LRGDHVHRLGLTQVAILDEALESQGPAGVDESDPVESISHVPLEEQRDVADDDLIAAQACLLDQPEAEALDLGMDDLIKFFQLVVIGEHDATQRRAIEVPVGGEDPCAPAGDDLAVGSGTDLDGPPSQDVGVDDGGTALGEHLRDGRFAAADVSGESYEEHDGFLGWGRLTARPGVVQA
jgi:hypothetical protein